MKDILIKEFFWLIIGSLLSLILSFIFLGLLELTSANLEMNEVEKVFSVQLYIIGCFVSLISIYIVRVVVNATKKYIIK
ncbi:MAG: hypothetical protein CBD72_02165 [Flavobacteriaceae bacterium TMED212]|nr:MAG: hypothetical protein CBD72_02165 [Flavobacteriaceae bacterium TMED212]|tara:strand:- start:388 stop:624 length:237 start_codon:yes stop_codon:yes gene_type:complete